MLDHLNAMRPIADALMALDEPGARNRIRAKVVAGLSKPVATAVSIELRQQSEDMSAHTRLALAEGERSLLAHLGGIAESLEHLARPKARFVLQIEAIFWDADRKLAPSNAPIPIQVQAYLEDHDIRLGFNEAPDWTPVRLSSPGYLIGSRDAEYEQHVSTDLNALYAAARNADILPSEPLARSSRIICSRPNTKDGRPIFLVGGDVKRRLETHRRVADALGLSTTPVPDPEDFFYGQIPPSAT